MSCTHRLLTLCNDTIEVPDNAASRLVDRTYLKTNNMLSYIDISIYNIYIYIVLNRTPVAVGYLRWSPGGHSYILNRSHAAMVAQVIDSIWMNTGSKKLDETVDAVSTQ